MKQLKKWTALLLALMLMITLVPWTAKAEFNQPTGTITVKGVEKGATVKAYRLTKANFDTNGNFLKYENVVKDAFANPQKPTDQEWKALVKDKSVNDLGKAIDLTWNGTDAYTASGQQAGLYMILVSSKAGYVYNPILVGLSYGLDSNPTGVTDGKIELPEKSGGSFQIPGQAILYMKKSEVTLKKTTSDPSEESQSTVNGQAGQSDKGNGLGLGEKPSFTIETTIPSYPKERFTNVQFDITDTLDKGLTAPEAKDIKVSVGGKDISPASDKFTVEVVQPKDGEGLPTDKGVITIKFAKKYLNELAGMTDIQRKVVIQYSATLNKNATSNFKANENNVSLTYTNDPKEDAKKITDKTYHYTFDIDGLLNGEGSETSHELTKHHDKTETTTWKDLPLEGAKFGLFDKNPSDQTAKMLQDVTTDGTGRMNFKKLDEGIYYIKEIQAPTGYSLNEKVYKVEIKADYNTDGTLKSYSIVIDDTATTTFKAVDVANDTDEIKDGVITEKDGATLINNTKTPELPTTGGMGTYLFTGIGVALLAGAAVMVTVLRKKNEQTTR